MKVLWITNIIFPEAMSLLSGHYEQKGSGGWMISSANVLIQNDDIELTVATVCAGINNLTRLHGQKILYYLLPYGKGNKKNNPEYESYWKIIKNEIAPVVIHIHGTEFSHGSAYVKACGANNVVVSIQGLIYELGKHYTDGLTKKDIYLNPTIHDFLKGTCFSEKKQWLLRGHYEKELLASVNHVIGRTAWDKAHVWENNPNANYYHCDETLRDPFYQDIWSYENCKPHSIFLSQSNYPIKGLHMVLKSMPMILDHYPDTTLRIAGTDITRYGIKHLTCYYKYLGSLIQNLNLRNHIHFCGDLTVEQMKNEYLRSNVFICPSLLENSSNSLCESLILGVPSIASFVGGLPTIMQGNESNLYRFDDLCLLAHLVCLIFDRNIPDLVAIRERSIKRHASNNNKRVLYDIYRKITCI